MNGSNGFTMTFCSTWSCFTQIIQLPKSLVCYMWPKFRVFLGLREEPTFTSYLFYLELIETPILNLFNPKLKWKKNVYYMHYRYNLNFPLIIYSRCQWYGVCSFHTLEIDLHFFLEHSNDMLWAKPILSVWWAVCTWPEYIFIEAC